MKPPPPPAASGRSRDASPLRRQRGRGCLRGGPWPCPGRTPALPAHLRTPCSCRRTGHPKPAWHWLSASHLAALLDGGFPGDAEEGEKHREKRKGGEDGCDGAAWGQLGVWEWDLLLGRGTRLRWCGGIKHQTRLRESQEGSGRAGSVACQLAEDRCKKLTQLLLPSPLPSQPHPFPKPPQRIKAQFAELVDDARRCPVRKAASEKAQILSPRLCLLPELSAEFLFLFFSSFGYSTTYLQNLDRIIAHYPAQLVPNPLP